MAFYLGVVLVASLLAAGLFGALYRPLEGRAPLGPSEQRAATSRDVRHEQGQEQGHEQGHDTALRAWVAVLGTGLDGPSMRGGLGAMLSASQQRFWLHFLASVR